MAEIAARRVVLGKIRTAVGLAGWVKVETYTDPPDNILRYPVWQLSTAADWRPARLQHSRWSGRELQVQFEQVVERNAADLLRGSDIAVFRHELPLLPPGEYYREDLLGLLAYTPQGECLGRLAHYRDSPAHPYLVLQDEHSGAENLVPLNRGRVLSADFAQGTMVLDWTLNWVD